MWLKQTHYEGILEFLSVKKITSYLIFIKIKCLLDASLCVLLQCTQDAFPWL